MEEEPKEWKSLKVGRNKRKQAFVDVSNYGDILLNGESVITGMSGDGYLLSKGGKVHRLVYTAFHGIIPRAHAVHHIDGNRENNKLSNLVLMWGADHTRAHR